MEFPSSLRFGARTVQVFCGQGLTGDPDTPEGHTYGEVRFDEAGRARMALSADGDDLRPETVSTFFHEILHLIDEDYGLELEERGVRTLEAALMGFFSANPTVLPVLQAGLSNNT